MQILSLSVKHDTAVTGLVPTMGCLHEGHISLIEKARKECSIVTVSIFVNPIQFGPGEDFARYPRDIEKDKLLAERAGVDFLFVPLAGDMYKQDFGSFVEVKGLEDVMCGNSRPGHFRGVCTVVMKLFNIVLPGRAYFGLKDYQQFLIIKKMTEDMNIPVEIIGCPIIREKDGLAMSSRNKYLTPRERVSAAIIYNSLNFAGEQIQNGEKDLENLKKMIQEKIKKSKDVAGLDYFDFRDPETLEEIEAMGLLPGNSTPEKILIACAAYIGSTRLIDNIIVNV